MVIGKVVDNWNEEKPGMIQVSYGLGKEGESQTGWIPVMMPYVGPSYGSYVLPETGTAVVVAFEQDNKNRPVVLGCIRTAEDALPENTANEENSKKLWKTRKGYRFWVDETEESVSYSDPEGQNTVSWSTKEKTLTVNVNEKLVINIGGEAFATVERGKITLEGDAELSVGGSLTLKASNITLDPEQGTTVKGTTATVSSTQEISMKSQQLSLEGTTAKLTGKQLNLEGVITEIKAKANLSIESNGMAAVKGTMLRLN